MKRMQFNHPPHTHTHTRKSPINKKKIHPLPKKKSYNHTISRRKENSYCYWDEQFFNYFLNLLVNYLHRNTVFRFVKEEKQVYSQSTIGKMSDILVLSLIANHMDVFRMHPAETDKHLFRNIKSSYLNYHMNMI